jgi:hypothetical protein
MAQPRCGGNARYDDRLERHHAQDSHAATRRDAASIFDDEPLHLRAVESAFRKAVSLPRESNKEPTMKRLFALSGIAIALLAGVPCALAQSSPPPLPSLTPQQSATLEQRLDSYRRQTEDRVSRGEITADEADRLIKWREWQIARQVAGGSSTPRPGARSDVPPDYVEPQPRAYAESVPPDYVSSVPPAYVEAPSREYVVVEPPPYYGPYYRYPAPYYWGPRSYYWGPAVCAGGFGRHFGGRICF